jgi:serine phosphatase RsbU (regulator of sigma subunit)
MEARRPVRPDAGTFWKRLPARSRLELLGAIFLLFSSIGFIADLVLPDPRRTAFVLAVQVVYAGLIAVGYALAFLQNLRLLLVVIVAQVVGAFVLRRVLPGFWEEGPLTGPIAAMRLRLLVDGIGILAGVVSSYVLFIRFIMREGIRNARLGVEAELARSVQNQLVPPIERRWGRFEIVGASVPSSEIGGDLVDLFEADGRAVVYVADVAGHGIAAGNLMGMVKTAARMSLSGGARLDAMLADLDRVLHPLKPADRFVTVAALELGAPDRIDVALAGHHPVLRFGADGIPDRIENRHVPVGVVAGTSYESTSIPVAPGDLIVVVSDGIIEVVGRNGEELGIEGVERLMREHASKSARDVARAVLAEARRRGPQDDDQTVLVVRVH